MKKYLKGILAIIFAVLVFIPATVFAEEVSDVFINKDNKISFTGADGYSVYQVYVKQGTTTIDAFGHNSNGVSTYDMATRIMNGCNNLTDVCPENYIDDYTLEIVALDTANSNAEVESTRTTKTISLKHEEFNGDDYYHVDVVGNEATYTITLDPDDGVQSIQQISGVKFGQYVHIADFETYGYVKQPKAFYLGWQYNDFNTTHDMTVKMEWEPLFTMSFDFNGGSLDGRETYTKESVVYGPSTSYDNVMSAFTPGKEVIPPVGKEIDYITVDGVRHEISPEDGFWFGSDVEIVYYWKWMSTTTVRTVTFTDGFDNVISTVEVADGDVVKQPNKPVMGGLLFSCWQLGNDCYNFATFVTQDITLEAFWNFKFNVVANVDGAAIFTFGGLPYPDHIGSAGYYHENEIVGIDQEEINGYALKEWRLDSLDGEIIGSDSSEDIYIASGGHLKIKETLETSGHTFYAIYEKTKVAVTFVTNGGTAIETQYVTPGEIVTRPAAGASTKEGYLLGDWYTDEALTHKFDFSIPIDEAITLYASWNIYIDEVRGTVGKPVIGFQPDRNIVSNDERYTFEFQVWYSTEAGTPHVEGTDVFQSGKEYEIRYYVKPAKGYAVDYNTKFYLNDEETSCFGSAAARQIRWLAASPKAVTGFDISGIVAPVAGSTLLKGLLL